MPLKDGRLTPGERVFSATYERTRDIQYSADKAGYAQPAKTGYTVAARPGVQAEVMRLQLERLREEILPLATAAHIDMLRNPATPAGAKVQAIRLAYDYGFGDGADRADKEMHEMTGAELAERIERLERRRANAATPVDVQAVTTPAKASVFD